MAASHLWNGSSGYYQQPQPPPPIAPQPPQQGNGDWNMRGLQSDAALAESVADAETPQVRLERLLADASKLWFTPVDGLLKSKDKLPAVRHLFVVPSREMGRVPMDLLAPGYRISYVSSATLLARSRENHRDLDARSLLALGDPVFQMPQERGIPTTSQ